jgi:hypothetical protein
LAGLRRLKIELFLVALKLLVGEELFALQLFIGGGIVSIAGRGIGLDDAGSVREPATRRHARAYRPSKIGSFGLQRTYAGSDLAGSGVKLRLRLLGNVAEPGELSAHRIGCRLNRI